MSCFDFRLLPEAEQVSLLYEEGTYLGKRSDKELIVLLYQLEGYYVEVFYRSYRRFIERIRVCESTAILDPYLDEIDVEYLVNE